MVVFLCLLKVTESCGAGYTRSRGGEFDERDKDEREAFRKHLGDYVRVYAFLSPNPDLLRCRSEEALPVFSRFLLRKLPVTRDKLPVEITENINLTSYRIQETSKATSAHSPTKSPNWPWSHLP